MKSKKDSAEMSQKIMRMLGKEAWEYFDSFVMFNHLILDMSLKMGSEPENLKEYLNSISDHYKDLYNSKNNINE